MKYLFVILVLVPCVLSIEHPEATLPFAEYCKHFNYPVEVHYIKCDDGYINTFFRVQKKNTTIRKLGLTPIYLQHGLLDSSDTWIVNDQDKAPGFILANKGYDVWVGNSRGNKHSLNHTKYNPKKDVEFWEFSFQDMADYDLPAAFRYIANQTQKKINYIGHSQGTIQMFIALSKNNPVI
jgi:pimeloyl-ACP methyl ester carboxylesterase